MNSKLNTVMVVDGGGRGAALVDKYLQSSQVKRVLAIPGNDLMTTQARGKVKIFPKVKTTDILPIIKICQREKVDLVDVAQDDAVACGLVDKLSRAGINVFGPTKAAGQIEWDKAWARNFMKQFKIPTPSFKVFNSQKVGIDYIKSQSEKSWFIKASGLALGKGALFAQDNEGAIDNIVMMKKFGKAGKTFLIEERLVGEEFSSFALIEGRDFVTLGHAQDHKPVYNGDLGPNTGGMGSTSPPAAITPSINEQIKSIFAKAAHGLTKIKRPYTGILYLGGMIDKSGKVYVIEFNARWGDPEAQVIIPGITNDWYQVVRTVLSGNIKKLKIITDGKYRLAVAAASCGYPIDYSQAVGKEIFGIDLLLRDNKVEIFGAGVKKEKGRYIVSGGRLFYVVAEGKNVQEARLKAYHALLAIYIEEDRLHYRTDIGYRDLERIFKSKK